jgi:hypothetical protein
MIEPKAIRLQDRPPVWLISLAAITIGCSYSAIKLAHKTETLQTAIVKASAETEETAEASETPTEEHNLGLYTYQYFAGEPSHQPYFRLLDRDLEVFRNSKSKASYKLLALESEPNCFVAHLSPSQPVIVVEQTLETSSEDAKESRQYLIFELAPIKHLATLDGGSNQFVLRKVTDKNNIEQVELAGNDQLDAWGQQPVSPKVAFELGVLSQTAPAKLSLQRSSPRKKEQLLKQSKELRALFADLETVEEVPITFAPAELAAEMADLIYEGNSKQAKFLFDHSWPPHRKGKAQFEKAFKAELAKGQFSDQVAALNHP